MATYELFEGGELKSSFEHWPHQALEQREPEARPGREFNSLSRSKRDRSPFSLEIAKDLAQYRYFFSVIPFAYVHKKREV